jgi:hypothetical protein
VEKSAVLCFAAGIGGTHGQSEQIASRSQLFTADKPRAAILATPDINIWGIYGLTTSNVVACLWKTSLKECPNIVIISLCCDIHKSAMGEVEAIMNIVWTINFP